MHGHTQHDDVRHARTIAYGHGWRFVFLPFESLRPNPGSPNEISGARDDRGVFSAKSRAGAQARGASWSRAGLKMLHAALGRQAALRGRGSLRALLTRRPNGFAARQGKGSPTCHTAPDDAPDASPAREQHANVPFGGITHGGSVFSQTDGYQSMAPHENVPKHVGPANDSGTAGSKHRIQ